MKNILITGGAGFIGSHLVDACLEKGYRVKAIDNLSVGRLENLDGALKNSNFEFHKADVSQSEQISAHFKGIDCVFHLAARADIVPSIQIPVIYHEANVNGTLNVLEASRKYKVQKFIYAASSSCYGIPDQYPTQEDSPIKPEYPYALTKYLGECYVNHWARVYHLNTLSLRFFNVYGPRARTSGTYGAVFGTFLAQKLNQLPFTVVGDGTQTRDFTYVSDIVDALLLAAKSNLSGDIFNVGSGGTYSISRLVELLGGEATYIPKRPGEPDCTFGDIRKINQHLGWKPKVSFEEGVKCILNNIEDWRDAPVWTPKSIQEATQDWFNYLS